ncbi:extracellular solute-binding protein [Oceanibacterium hippocampi]|uniref:Oligopeptide-binding protein AppA n=1 Tax=Oceanibacterium hippocampi TaxID=745714 RepID=A0A1Y5T829_9PROT|nr:extracellular solute-binding protein [Oceanibacterium hippocampi]SLN57987.1 Oligopeptide-binding protein AppA precursor [Oceanibacterium hippocampi]
MHGPPAHGAGFPHYDHVRADAPIGGTLTIPAYGSFDSFNPNIVLGVPAQGLGLVRESLMARSLDEPFTLYGLLAKSIDVAPDRTWVTFRLDERARFHDGSPVTPEDVLFSWRLLKDKGRPNLRLYYRAVVGADALDGRRVRFRFADGENRELPLILGLMPILAAHATDADSFDRPGLAPLLGSGPYRIKSWEPGREVRYRRVADYWGAGLAINRGRYNFDSIRFRYYRDQSVAFEDFKAGGHDFTLEGNPERWARGYDFPAAKDGRVRRLSFTHHRSAGMFGLAFNNRRAPFDATPVRRAIALAFDFDWINRAYFDGAMTRTTSFFENSKLAASGPASEAERALLARHVSPVPERLLAAPGPEAANGISSRRDRLLRAGRLLDEAGWRIVDGARQDGDGQPLAFEVLLNDPALKRVMLALAANLRRLGVTMRIRSVDSASYQQRLSEFDFDAIVYFWGQSLSPGTEQYHYWSQAAARTPGSRNYPGIESPLVDALIGEIVAARDRAGLVAATRALDRVLLAGAYVLPLYHDRIDRLAYWRSVGVPDRQPPYGLDMPSWWSRDAEARSPAGRENRAPD